MNPNLPIDYLLDEFLQGKLSKDVLLNQLPGYQKEALEEEISLHRAATVFLQKAPVVNQVAQIHEQFLKENRSNAVKQPGRVASFVKWISVAASIILVAGVVYWQFGSAPTPAQLYSELYMPYTIPVYRAESTTTTPFAELYQQQKQAQLIQLYEQQHPTDNQSHLLAGLSYMNQEQWTQAAAAFQQVLQNNSGKMPLLYQDEAQYYSALSYLKTGDYTKALHYFRLIVNDAQHTYHQQISVNQLSELEALVRK